MESYMRRRLCAEVRVNTFVWSVLCSLGEKTGCLLFLCTSQSLANFEFNLDDS